MSKLITITDDNFQQHLDYVGPDGEKRAKGLRPRDFSTHPVGYLGAVAAPFGLKLIDESEWDERIVEQEAKQSSLQHIRDKGNNGQPIPSYDQDGIGYCWAHAPTSAVTLVRALNNQPFVPLSAFAVGCMIKNFRDQGGFGPEGLQFIAQRGIPSAQFWPMQSMDRANDNSNTWTNAKLHTCESWWDLSNDSNLVRQQLATLLLLNVPVSIDLDWWSHVVCAVRLIKRDPFTIRIWNSWRDSWSQNGMGDLVGSKAIPDGAVAPRVMTAATT